MDSRLENIRRFEWLPSEIASTERASRHVVPADVAKDGFGSRVRVRPIEALPFESIYG